MDPKLRARIDALMAKTVENGCSEAEAMTAAGLLANILQMHGLTIDDVQGMVSRKDAEGCVTKFWGKGGAQLPPVQWVAGAIAELFDCRVWRTQTANGTAIKYFGLEQDVYAACTLTDLIHTAMEAEWARWFRVEGKRIQKSAQARGDVQAAKQNHGRRLRNDFMTAMAGRLTQRLEEMKVEHQRVKIEGAPGTALVVLKNQLVEIAMKEKGMSGGTTRTVMKANNNTQALAAGAAAADRVALSVGTQVGG